MFGYNNKNIDTGTKACKYVVYDFIVRSKYCTEEELTKLTYIPLLAGGEILLLSIQVAILCTQGG